jgi:phage replication O-like protein O
MSKQNPQLEDGYTKIANKILEILISASLTLLQTKILLAIIRQTYGYNRKEAEISTRIFEKMTGIDRRNIQKTISQLLDCGIIIRREGRTAKFFNPVYNYVINKKRVCEIYATPGVDLTPIPGVDLTPIKERNKILNKRRVETVDKLQMPK